MDADPVENPQELIRRATEAISKKQSEAVEALCLALLLEKGAESVLDYELCQQIDGLNARWWFRKRGPAPDGRSIPKIPDSPDTRHARLKPKGRCTCDHSMTGGMDSSTDPRFCPIHGE